VKIEISIGKGKPGYGHLTPPLKPFSQKNYLYRKIFHTVFIGIPARLYGF
jgi:hypothetical protein